ncbi:UDP-N-acetylglucosamine 1-carboxyvinyltransferase [Flavilitoribacter nigricans]|uniref:UDP-N-acetylglucosamine 1-carboxyvinyltransferase n=1 Tax=Flavilitoribacter nigricans (strain ATCC 23147 / DSM 23189 / NBRC 102662 / NCIMB 1420 / SS-2) TaxID=1122177 RepID=A0A2D0N3V1_FLAN2|nr:UDP-N-acetylglucosamine 1-carboxyvinyltransferase [Flavilitoribacter nigricans]PHN03184.1 UDP-N-acetylglucosamine 1-carboxyvinyltransferase [Flavilitoribacter nigricans DSM 23189 = NBRC 102662]
MTNESFAVTGGRSLRGDLVPQGAKNEALQVLCAVLLSAEPVTIANVPEIRDVAMLLDLLRGLGVEVEKLNSDTYRFTAREVDLDYVQSDAFEDKARRIRGSVMLIGPLLARYGRAFLPKPGGDKIGRRRLDTHFLGLQQLGAQFDYDVDRNQYSVTAKKLKGTYILMDEISLTGTANVIMAAVLAEGVTRIYNAACEPYIQQLCRMLTRMGAKIEGLGSNLLAITGVEELGGTEHRILPDMIEIGSFIGLAAMTQSEITIKDVQVHELGIIPRVFEKMGVQLEIKGDDIHIPYQEEYEIQTFIDGSIMTIYDAPWPGFTPDLMSIILVMATQAKGSLLVHQKMFESRLFFVDKLIDMGAQIILCDPHRATVIGLNRRFQLRGIEMTSPDIRAGVALLIAALSAKGTSIIHNINQIDRGYQRIDERLRAIGAQIERV